MTAPPPDDVTRTSANDGSTDAAGSRDAEGTSWFADPEALLESLRGVPRSGLPSIPGYEILHEIARGGQGTVFLARQRSTRRQVAVKLLLERGFATASARRRFEREIELLASIDHPGIVKVFDSGVSTDGRLYLVMELVAGVPLDQAIDVTDAKGTSTDAAETHRRTLRLMAEVADAVHAAHRRGVIHRDLKPSNILVDAEGHPRIVDFGLARAIDPREGEVAVSVTGQFVGSLPWASPEHASGAPEAVDVRSDVYSLGVVLYQALTGSLPYAIDHSFAAAIKAITEAIPQRPSALVKGISRDLDAVVLTCLAKDPEARYGSAAELAADLRAVVQHAPIRARRDSTWDGMSRALRRYRLITAISSAALVAVAALGGIAWWQSRIAERERTLAVRRFDEARELARAFLFEFHEAVLPLAGSRPAREKIVATALDYLHGLEDEIGDDPQFRSDLAAAYERVADIQGNPTFPNLGQSAEAIASLRASVALRQANLAQRPEDVETLRMTGRALGLIGLIQWQTGASDEALTTLAEGDGLLQRARAIAPRDPLLLREIAANRDRAATLRDMHGELDASLSLLEEGIAALDGVEDAASVRDALDVLLFKKAFTLRKAGKLEESLAASLRSIEINRTLIAEQPESAARRRSLSVSLNELATTQMALRRLEDAGRTLEESITVARELHRADAANPTTINDLAYALAKSAALERERGDYEASVRVYGEVHELRAEASRRDPSNAVIRRGAAIAVGMAAESAEAAIADPATPTDRHAAFARRAIDRYEECHRLLKSMQDDGVMLKGDETLLDAFTQAIARLRPLAGDASGTGTP